jgi:hypothetical protein
MKPQRFLVSGHDAKMEQFALGDWVMYEDYIELQAKFRYLQSEVERLKNNIAYLDKKLDDELAR